MLCWLMHWTLDDLRALDKDEFTTLVGMIRDGDIKPLAL